MEHDRYLKLVDDPIHLLFVPLQHLRGCWAEIGPVYPDLSTISFINKQKRNKGKPRTNNRWGDAGSQDRLLCREQEAETEGGEPSPFLLRPLPDVFG